MNSARTWIFGSLALAALLFALLGLNRHAPPSPTSTTPSSAHSAPGSLMVYCAAGLKPPVEAVARAYEKEFGIPIELQYGGSGTLLSSLKVAGRGDLFLAADDSYLQLARSNGLVAETLPLASMRPVIGVAKGNPHHLRSLADLARVRVALANPDAAAIGQVTRDALRRAGMWTALEGQAKVFKPTVNDIANDLKLGAVDAGIVWDATVRQYPELEMIEAEELALGQQRVAIGVLNASTQPTAALRFARYLGAPEKGLAEFRRLGYTPVDGDAWEETPSVVLYSGGVNRLAIEETLQRFEQREGARISRVYNGCGILVAQMKAGQRPDAYFACDVSFLRQVTNLFPRSLDVSRTRMVLLVARDNPKQLRGLEDLTQPGLRLGVANAEQSALGALTARLLDARGLRERVMANVRVQTPTADLLVNQMRSGSLDAVIVYTANTSMVRDSLTVVPLPEPEALATQPYAVLENSRHRHLMDRLLATIRSAESRRRFEDVGFDWVPAPSSLP